MESLYEELVHEGILVRAPKTKLREYTGEYRYSLTTQNFRYFSYQSGFVIVVKL